MRIRFALGAALAVTLALTASATAGTTRSDGLLRVTGKGEGTLKAIAWEGYGEPAWVKGYEAQTGCQASFKYAGSSDEMVTAMRSGGGYDVVSASGDASNRLIASKLVSPIDISQIPDWKNFLGALKSPPNNTVGGKHYGVSWLWGPNVLVWNPKKFTTAPTSWSAIYDKANSGKITVPDNPIQIADAALYLSKTQPKLGIKDVYELTSDQLNAAVALLKAQRPLVKKYWVLASDEIAAFTNGGVTIGAAWPLVPATLIAHGVAVKSTIPKEGATGWADTWMVSSKAPHPNCAMLWLKYTAQAKVQAMAAKFNDYTPANSASCAILGKLCTPLHADADAKYFAQIKFWKTPISDCGNGKTDCMSYNAWQQAWTEIKG
jgi:putative spermidine/putrescine transport system substrate-binding protein